jgi:hypothetical protein
MLAVDAFREKKNIAPRGQWKDREQNRTPLKKSEPSTEETPPKKAQRSLLAERKNFPPRITSTSAHAKRKPLGPTPVIYKAKANQIP